MWWILTPRPGVTFALPFGVVGSVAIGTPGRRESCAPCGIRLPRIPLGRLLGDFDLMPDVRSCHRPRTGNRKAAHAMPQAYTWHAPAGPQLSSPGEHSA